jgi:hypothetical protein
MAISQRCAICSATHELRGVIVDGTELFLCAEHAERLGGRIPSSFEELTRLVTEQGLCRRSGEDRRRGERRMFPRPERRRHNMGRRVDDPG